jgi:hypothetical protein
MARDKFREDARYGGCGSIGGDVRVVRHQSLI